MIAVTAYAGKNVAVFGLGKSGIVAALSLIKGGASVVAFDDNEASIAAAIEKGITVKNLEELDWNEISALVLSPGVPLTHPKPHWSVDLANNSNTPIIGDVDLFFQQKAIDAPDAKTVCITGTNGKSTTTALITHILNHSGKKAVAVGNIGNPILAESSIDNDLIYVIECSSYQIDLAPNINPDIALIINISADHIDRHGSVENYASVKSKLLDACLQNNGIALVSIDDNYSQKIANELNTVAPDSVKTVSLDSNDANIYLSNNQLKSDAGDIFISEIDKFQNLRGKHNFQNIAFAFEVNSQLFVNNLDILTGLSSFPGLSHRMEIVGQIGSAIIVNDSKATNADAAERSLASFENIHWICGGMSKKGGIEPLESYFSKIVHAYLIGRSIEEFSKTLDGKLPYHKSELLEKAVQQAIECTSDSDTPSVILLAPACASWDQFKSFEHRGDVFKQVAQSHPDFKPIN